MAHEQAALRSLDVCLDSRGPFIEAFIGTQLRTMSIGFFESEVANSISSCEHADTGDTSLRIASEHKNHVLGVKLVDNGWSKSHRRIPVHPQHQASIDNRHLISRVELLGSIRTDVRSERHLVGTDLFDLHTREECLTITIDRSFIAPSEFANVTVMPPGPTNWFPPAGLRAARPIDVRTERLPPVAVNDHSEWSRMST
jgi:hypothetical protein